MIDIDKAFEGRWRFLMKNNQELYSHEMLRRLCRDFFEAGVLLNDNAISYVETDAPSFDTFWNLYDKKVGREKCVKLWSKLSQKERQACLSYIPFYRKAQPDKQYRKNPETFLRNKSWHDEIIEANRKPTAADLADKAARILQG